MKELAKATDRRLAELHLQAWDKGVRLSQYEDAARRAAGQRQDYYSRQWSGSWDDVLASTHPIVVDYVGKADEVRTALASVKTEISALNRVYSEHRWSRFFLVSASNGHIHSSMDCHSCYPTTEYVWLPELSGETEADAVAAEGEILCTFCFPSAPTAWTEGIGRRTREQQDAKAAEKAARLAAKVEKSLSLDGSVVNIEAPLDETNRWGRHKEFKTYKAAELWLVDALVTKRCWLEVPRSKTFKSGPDAMSDDNILLVAEMMATKKGVTIDAIIEGLEKRVDKKAAQEIAWCRQ